eukprot:1145203-Pelagomonas_calceolata.AAC.5
MKESSWVSEAQTAAAAVSRTTAQKELLAAAQRLQSSSMPLTPSSSTCLRSKEQNKESICMHETTASGPG